MKKFIKKVAGGLRSFGKRLRSILDPYADEQNSRTGVFGAGKKNRKPEELRRPVHMSMGTTPAVASAQLSQQELQESLSPEYKELHQRLDHWLRTTGDGYYDHKIPQDLDAYKKQLDGMKPVLDKTDKERTLAQARYRETYRASSEAVAQQRSEPHTAKRDRQDKEWALERKRSNGSYAASVIETIMAKQRAAQSASTPASTIAKAQPGTLTRNFANATSTSPPSRAPATAPAAPRAGTTTGTRAPKAAAP